jgi:hypothetical protein
MISLAPERWWQNGPYAAERRESGECSSAKERCRPLGGCFYPVRVSDLAIFDYGDCENSEERYFRLLKGRRRLPYIAASQKARLSQARIALCFCGRKVRDT